MWPQTDVHSARVLYPIPECREDIYDRMAIGAAHSRREVVVVVAASNQSVRRNLPLAPVRVDCAMCSTRVQSLARDHAHEPVRGTDRKTGACVSERPHDRQYAPE